MYIPEMFQESDVAEIESLMDRYNLAIIVASLEDGLTAHHLPLLRDGADRLIGHVGFMRFSVIPYRGIFRRLVRKGGLALFDDTY